MLRLLLLSLLFLGCARLDNGHEQNVLDCGPELARGQDYLTVLNSRGIRMLTGFEVISLDSGKLENLVTSRGCVVKKTGKRYLIRATATDEAAVFDMSAYKSRGAIALHDYTGQSVSIACKDEVRRVASSFAIESLLQTNIQADLQDAVQLEYEFVKPARAGSSFSLAGAGRSLPLLGDTAEGLYEVKLFIKNHLNRGELEATCRLELDRTPPQIFVSVNGRQPTEIITVHETGNIASVGVVDSISFLADKPDVVTVTYCIVPLSDNFDQSDKDARSAWLARAESRSCAGHKVLTASLGETIAADVKSGFWSIKFQASDAVGNVAPPQIQNILILNKDSHRLIKDNAQASIVSNASMSVVEKALRAEVMRSRLPTRFERDLEKEVTLSGLLQAYYQETVSVEINAHFASVRALDLSEDGRILVSSSFDNTLKLWNVTTGQNIWSVTADVPDKIALSPNGQYIAAIASTGSVLAFDAQNGSYLRTLRPGDLRKKLVNQIQFGPDGQSVLVGIGNTIEIRSFESGEILRVLAGHTKDVRDFTVLPGQQLVVSIGADGTLRYWDFVTASNLKTVEADPSRSSKPDDPSHMVASSDGKTILLRFASGRAALWNDDGTFLKWAPKLPHSTSAIALKRDGTVFSAEENIKVWVGDEVKKTLSEHAAPIVDMILSPDEQSLITASDDSMIRIWRLGIHQEKKRFEAPYEVTSLVFAPDGKSLVSGSLGSGDLWLWPIHDGDQPKKLGGHKSIVGALAVSGSGKFLASGGAEGDIVLQTYAGDCCRAFQFTPAEAIASVSLSHDGRYLVAATANGGVKLWETDGTGEAREIAGPSFGGTVASISPDGSRIAAAGLNDTTSIEIRDSQSGGLLFPIPGHAGFLNGLPFSGDGQKLAAFGPSAKSINLLDLSSRKVVSKVVGDMKNVMSLALTAQGSRAVAGTLTGKILLIDFEQKRQIAIPMNGTLPTIGVAMAPDGRSFATGGYDKTIRIWDLDNGPIHRNICARLKDYLDPELCSDFVQ